MVYIDDDCYGYDRSAVIDRQLLYHVFVHIINTMRTIKNYLLVCFCSLDIALVEFSPY
jgi:hypothetical protein